MSIIWNKENNTITLHTRHTSYQMKVDSQKVLLHTYYGSRVDDTDFSYQICRIDRGFSGNPYEKGKTDRQYSLDILPQEYSCTVEAELEGCVEKLYEKYVPGPTREYIESMAAAARPARPSRSASSSGAVEEVHHGQQ